MNIIMNFFDPSRLLISWQQPTGSGVGHSRKKFVVAELYKSEQNVFFRYRFDSKDLQDAMSMDFVGHPSFAITDESHTGPNILNTFLKRLPPRNRSDYGEYLRSFCLPANFDGSEFSLLAYTGAKLPSDTFEIYPDLSTISPPYEFIIELAGTRYLNTDLTLLSEGEAVTFEPDPTNAFDSDAINVIAKNQIIGFIPRPLNKDIKQLLLNTRLTAYIHNIKLNASRPLVYIFTKIA